ncbi:MAG: acetyl-CoA decarbonylase/synthase complex subunit gamma [Theionarchaea archaeon]|nr:acetyl-CoA decarbonylase/synthase complex subunit gamma [Theionarchaea archaeon]MBU6999205.1 acetyl-CoA decarbonylase/synthase complex subunit gamma [Theionarchaea archaeon]MBU7019670.1 acetyl-CoA decarbonylase/synthase complex subunit gamma [Theionarchaea archaeon]MBU7041316.1 acetyl-CoA decarbonylase/synthase complex subunit gamma [Theionarchaea archaeon]
MKRLGPLDLYRHLPKTNCGECGEKTCMAFASQIIERTVKLTDCPYLKGSHLEALIKMTSPAVRQVVFGKKSPVKIGGEDVLYRHELTYFNETAIAIDVDDRMTDDELLERVAYVTNFSHERIGQELTLQAVAIKNVSQDPAVFAECVQKVAAKTDKALIVCSFLPESLEAALSVCDDNPLLYAATKDTWEQVGGLAMKYDCPVVAFADNNLSELKSVVHALQSMGLKDIAVDPGIHPENLSATVNEFVEIRRVSMNEDDTMNCPIIGIPAACTNPMEEVMSAALMIDRFADLLIFHTTDMYAVLPVITLRQNIYTDPRRPVSVDAGLRTFGTPTKESPLLATTNFALTYYTVASDIESSGLNAYLLVFDTEGLGVEASVAGGQLDAYKAKEAIEKTQVKDVVSHKKIIIPGMAARISGELEQISGWEVLVGPRDSSGIPEFLNKRWN